MEALENSAGQISAHQKSLRIGIVSETYTPEINGVARTLERFVTCLAHSGHQIDLIRPTQGHFDSRADLSVARTTLVPGIHIPFYKDLRIGWPLNFRTATNWEQEPPDVLYIATEGPLGLAAMRLARRLNIPVVSGFHTNFPNYADHYRIGFLRPLILAYLKTFHNRANATLVPTRGLKEDLTKKGFRNLHVLGRGIDLTLFSPEQRSIPLRRNWGVENDSLAVLYVGRLAAEKNLQLALKAFTRMQEANPAARFILVGDGPLRKKIAAERPDLIVAGPQTGRRLAKHYASADVFLFPSLTETFGNVTLEALASGLAVGNYSAQKNHKKSLTGFLRIFPAFSAIQGLASNPCLRSIIIL